MKSWTGRGAPSPEKSTPFHEVKSMLLVWGAAALIAVPPAFGGAAADPYSHATIAGKNYEGVTLHVLVHEKPVLGEPAELHAREFERLTGATIILHHIPFDRLHQEVMLGLRQKKYDILFYGSMWVADVAPYLQPVPQEMLASAQYRDVLPHYRQVAKWGNVIYQVPIDGDRHYLQYRRDLLENPLYRAQFKEKTGRELAVPRTWPELQEIAGFFHGMQLENGRTISGISEITVSDGLLGNQFIKRAAPYAKHPDVKGGFYFDLETMEPLINTPGFVEALRDFVAAQNLYPQGGQRMSFPEVIRSFGSGESVFSDCWDDPFIQAMEPGNPLRNNVAAALSPGSHKVWNRKTGQWDFFPEVNYAPYIAYGWTAGVPLSTPHKEAAFSFLGFFANPGNHRSDMLIGRFGINPFRTSDLDANFWVKRAGWDPVVARSYIETLEKMNKSRNRVLDLRIHRGQEYLYLLSVGVYRAITGRDTPQAALDEVAERWRKLTARVGIDRQREAYQHQVRFEDNE